MIILNLCRIFNIQCLADYFLVESDDDNEDNGNNQCEYYNKKKKKRFVTQNGNIQTFNL